MKFTTVLQILLASAFVNALSVEQPADAEIERRSKRAAPTGKKILNGPQDEPAELPSKRQEDPASSENGPVKIIVREVDAEIERRKKGPEPTGNKKILNGPQDGPADAEIERRSKRAMPTGKKILNSPQDGPAELPSKRQEDPTSSENGPVRRQEDPASSENGPAKIMVREAGGHPNKNSPGPGPSFGN